MGTEIKNVMGKMLSEGSFINTKWDKIDLFLKQNGFKSGHISPEGNAQPEVVNNGTVEILVDCFPYYVTEHKEDKSMVGKPVFTVGFIRYKLLKQK